MLQGFFSSILSPSPPSPPPPPPLSLSFPHSLSFRSSTRWAPRGGAVVLTTVTPQETMVSGLWPTVFSLSGFYCSELCPCVTCRQISQPRHLPCLFYFSCLFLSLSSIMPAQFIFVLRKKGSKMKKRMKEEVVEKGDCGPPTRSLFLRFCRTWTKQYLITSQARVKRLSRIHHRAIHFLFLPPLLLLLSHCWVHTRLSPCSPLRFLNAAHDMYATSS